MGELHTLPSRPREPDPEAEARRERALAVRRLIEANPGSLPGARDHADYAARELHRILKAGGRDLRRRVCEIAFGSNARVPTKRLWGVLIDPDTPREAAPLPAVKRKRLTIYLRLADAVAAASGQDEAEVILRVFPDIASDPEPAVIAREPGLTEALRDELWNSWLRANETIIQDCDLRRALAIAMEYPRSGGGPLQRFRLDINQVLGRDEGAQRFGGRSEINYRFSASPWDFVFGVAPLLFLGECHGPTFHGTVAALAPDGTVGEPLPDFGVWMRIWVRFWWAVLPIGPHGEARGCFLASLVTERAPSPIPAEDLKSRAAEDDERPSPLPWTSLLGSKGARDEYHWTNRDLWHQRNTPGLILSWDMAESYSLDAKPFEGPWRCTAVLDVPSRRIIRGVFGCEAEALPVDPVRILPASAHWRDLILGLPDGALAGWVGPDPDETGIAEPPKPHLPQSGNDEVQWAAYREQSDSYWEAHGPWSEAEIEYQSFPTIQAESRSEFVPLRGFPEIIKGSVISPTIGSKFERSLLYLPEADRPDVALRRRAEGLRQHAAAVTARAAAGRRATLAQLGRSLSTD